MLASASHDGVLKFWCREPPGSLLESDPGKEQFLDNPTVAYGPVQVGTPNVIPISAPLNIQQQVAQQSAGPGGRETGRPRFSGGQRGGGGGGQSGRKPLL